MFGFTNCPGAAARSWGCGVLTIIGFVICCGPALTAWGQAKASPAKPAQADPSAKPAAPAKATPSEPSAKPTAAKREKAESALDRGISAAELLVTSSGCKYGPEFKQIDDAVAAFTRGKPADARKILLEVVKAHPELMPADVMMARLHLMLGRTREAEMSLDQAIVTDPNDPEAYLILADIAAGENRRSFAAMATQLAAEPLKKYTKNPVRTKEHLEPMYLALRATVADTREQFDIGGIL